jgi:uncharacterized membrane protein YfhO
LLFVLLCFHVLLFSCLQFGFVQHIFVFCFLIFLCSLKLEINLNEMLQAKRKSVSQFRQSAVMEIETTFTLTLTLDRPQQLGCFVFLVSQHR